MDAVGFYGNGSYRHVQPSIASTMDEVKATLAAIQQAQQKQGAELQRVSEELNNLKHDVHRFQPQTPNSSGADAQISTPPSSRRIPPELSAAVRGLYSSLPEEEKFLAKEGYKTVKNQRVAAYLMDQLQKMERLEDHRVFFSRAVYRYYESRRRLHNDAADTREDAVKSNEKITKKRRAQKKLYTQRSSVVKNKEKEGWSQIDFRYMTDESDGEADGTKQTHQPSWRSSALNKLIKKLDCRLAKKKGTHNLGFASLPRVVGVSSLSNPPDNAPEWAVINKAQVESTSEVQNSETLHVSQQSSSELLDTPPLKRNTRTNRRRLTYSGHMEGSSSRALASSAVQRKTIRSKTFQLNDIVGGGALSCDSVDDSDDEPAVL